MASRSRNAELRQLVHTLAAVACVIIAPARLQAQKVLTWEQTKQQFSAANPVLQASRIGIQESKAQETTAFLKPNPNLTAGIDQLNPFASYTSAAGNDVYRPLANVLPLVSVSYLYERQHKRDLRLESAQQATSIVRSQQEDLERNMLFALRTAFIQALQAKAALAVNRESLDYYDKVLALSRERLKAGDIARIDLQRLELQRIQFLTDVQTSEVNLRTAKIQLLALLNDRTPIDQFDVTGAFDFREQLDTLEELRSTALASRPDLQAAVQAIEKAQTDHRLAIANGTADPSFGVDFGRNPPIPVYMGVSMSIPLRIHDKNQGEKERTQLEIGRAERVRDAGTSQVYGDVDSAYATVNSQIVLLRPYKTAYLQQAADVRETISFAYQHGGASLLDFLNAQNDYRSIQLNYLNLVAAYLNSANQLNLAVGREVIQ